MLQNVDILREGEGIQAEHGSLPGIGAVDGNALVATQRFGIFALGRFDHEKFHRGAGLQAELMQKLIDRVGLAGVGGPRDKDMSGQGIGVQCEPRAFGTAHMIQRPQFRAAPFRHRGFPAKGGHFRHGQPPDGLLGQTELNRKFPAADQSRGSYLMILGAVQVEAGVGAGPEVSGQAAEPLPAAVAFRLPGVDSGCL